MRFYTYIFMVFWGVTHMSLASEGFDGYYCSAVDSEGDWAVAYGEHPADFYCNLVAHQILHDGGEMTSKKKGHYVINDLNEVTVKCLTPDTSFKLVDFGGYSIRRAKQQAEEAESVGCLFRVREYP